MPKFADYVCQQCRALRHVPDCEYSFHPESPNPDDDRWRQAAEKQEATHGRR